MFMNYLWPIFASVSPTQSRNIYFWTEEKFSTSCFSFPRRKWSIFVWTILHNINSAEIWFVALILPSEEDQGVVVSLWF